VLKYKRPKVKGIQSLLCTSKETWIRSRRELRWEGSWWIFCLFVCLEKEMSFLAIKIIFRSVISYGYNLVQSQQIPLAAEKQWRKRLRNVIIIIPETPAFFQARLTNSCWSLLHNRRPSYTLPGLPRHTKQGCTVSQDAHPTVSPLSGDLQGMTILNTFTRPESEQGDGHP